MVEQGTHKPLVGSSTLPPGMFELESVSGLSFATGQLAFFCEDFRFVLLLEGRSKYSQEPTAL